MKLDFSIYNPTKIHFGKNALDKLAGELKNYGPNVLLVYGKESIKKIGLYDKVINVLKSEGKNVTELPGIKSNPTYVQVLEGAKLVRENKVDLILAVGGGSVIDCSKGISVAAYCDGDPWTRFWINGESVEHNIVPVGSVLTMVGTASEMNSGSVITNDDVKLKMGRVFEPFVNPRFSILNPEYTYSVPKYQMVSGIFDAFSHLMEQYFGGDEEHNTSDYILEGLMRSLIDNGRIAIKNPTDYEARSNIMWAATMALNKITAVSKIQDWEVHMIEHQLGAYTDCAHGIGLAIISIPYYEYIYPYGIDKFVRFAKNVWNVNIDCMSKEEAAREGLSKLKDFIIELGIPTTLRELGTTEEMLPLIANSTVLGGGYKQLSSKEVLEILKKVY